MALCHCYSSLLLHLQNTLHTLKYSATKRISAMPDMSQNIWKLRLSGVCIDIRIFLCARASIAMARISYGNSVRPSVCLSRPSTIWKPREIDTSGFDRMIA